MSENPFEPPKHPAGRRHGYRPGLALAAAVGLWVAASLVSRVARSVYGAANARELYDVAPTVFWIVFAIVSILGLASIVSLIAVPVLFILNRTRP
jgi:hypothetical protein